MICPERASRIEINQYAHVAQLVEHVLGKDGVTGSNPVVGSVFEINIKSVSIA